MTDFLVQTFVRDYQQVESPKVRERYAVLSSMVGMICNIILFAVKMVLGTLTNSIAITADAFNNLTDVGSCAITFAGFKIAALPADKRHPFGHGRVEYLTGLVISFLILSVGLEVGKTSIQKIFHPEQVMFSTVAVIGLLASIAVKLWMSRFNGKLGDRINSAAMKATAADSLSDAVSTGASVAAVVAAAFTDWPVDGVIGTIVALLILKAGWEAAADTLNPLLGEKADPELVKNLEKQLLSYDGVLGIHDLVIHDYGPGRRFATVHAEVPADQPIMISHEIIDRAERHIGKELNLELVIHMDPLETDSEITNKMRKITAEKVQEIDPAFTIHDFRMVPGENLTNLIFDICVTDTTHLTDDEIIGQVTEKLRQIDPDYYTVIQIDHSYV